MDPVVTLKRASEFDSRLCVFCQKRHKTNEDVRQSTAYSRSVVHEAMKMRSKFGDVDNREAISRLEGIIESTDDSVSIVWHRECYSVFTSTHKIDRLQKKCVKTDDTTREPPVSSPCKTRSHVDQTNWEVCVFCQNQTSKEKLSSVMTFTMSEQICEIAKYNYRLRIRLAGVSDLIASEAKYHLACFSAFKRSAENAKTAIKDTDLALVWLCQELEYAADKGHVIKMSDAWNRYTFLAEKARIKIPASFISRRATFKDKLMHIVGDIVECVQSCERGPSDRHTLLIPKKFAHIALSQLVSERSAVDDDLLTMPVFQCNDDIFLSLVHVAFKIRADLRDKPGFQGLNINAIDAQKCVPESLYIFLQLLFGGDRLFEGQTPEEKENKIRCNALSIAQDIVYGVSSGKKWTPKHVGLGSTLHQVTRSKDLVDLFHKAGHILSYDQILQVDTGLAEHVLSSLDPDTGTVIPPNLNQSNFIHFSADNIDILDETMDGKNTFHATQIAAWQRGSDYVSLLDGVGPSKKRILDVPESMDRVNPIDIRTRIPVFIKEVKTTWFNSTEDDEEKHTSEATDLAFNILRCNDVIKSGWTTFNKSISPSEQTDVTKIGYMPILQAPAHEFDTLNAVVKRCMHVSSKLGQRYTVITVDQALYCKLVELKWAVPEYQEKLVVLLGGLHISMCFLNTIGNHMNGSGLAETWVESDLLGPNAAEHVMNGKAYKRAMRAHKLTSQALWRMLVPLILRFCEQTNEDLAKKIADLQSSSENPVEELIGTLESSEFQEVFEEFVAEKSLENVNFKFWWSYLEMVSILLNFTRAQREGNWALFLHSFCCMLPYFFRYDHLNYAKWGSVFIAEMRQLPVEVLHEFNKGNFVVKWSEGTFNQVSADHSLEWLNGIGKRGGGIVGITKTSSALSRWALSYNLRSEIAEKTHEMFCLKREDVFTDNESTRGRVSRDNKDEDSLYCFFQQYNVFSPTSHPECLYNIATKDLVTEEIQESLLNAKHLGQRQVGEFVNQRLIEPFLRAQQSSWEQDKAKQMVRFSDTMHRNNPLTFDTLYQIAKVSKEKDNNIIFRADRSVLQRLLVACQAGREVDLLTVLSHELMPVPVSLAETNGKLRTGQKAELANVLTKEIECPKQIDLQGRAELLIDGMALVAAIGKPTDAKTFGDLGDKFLSAVLGSGSRYHEIHVLFDRYEENSIKAGTRERRTKTTRPIRRVIENRNVPLPSSWPNFLALPENKADLARFLSEHLIANAPPDKVIVVAGGFNDGEKAQCSNEEMDSTMFYAAHEEADTRIVYHCIASTCDTVVVSARDTDVLLLLVAHAANIRSANVWMMAGTAAHRKFFNIRAISESLPAGSLSSILPFHALTGSDTTSFLCNHSKTTAWKIFLEKHNLLSSFGEGNLTSTKIKDAEKFVCAMYKHGEVESVNQIRVLMFPKCGKPQALPPTRDALELHIKRSHYQALVWKQASCQYPILPNPDGMGWMKVDGKGLVPRLMTLDPIPKACKEIISCSCKSGCTTLRCGCKRAKLFCTSVCGCAVNSNENNCCKNKPTS